MASKGSMVALGQWSTWKWIWLVFLISVPLCAAYLARNSADVGSDAATWLLAIMWSQGLFLFALMVGGMVALRVAGPRYDRIFLGVLALVAIMSGYTFGKVYLDKHTFVPTSPTLAKVKSIDAFIASFKR